jgi:hypothetical protein
MSEGGPGSSSPKSSARSRSLSFDSVPRPKSDSLANCSLNENQLEDNSQFDLLPGFSPLKDEDGFKQNILAQPRTRSPKLKEQWSVNPTLKSMSPKRSDPFPQRSFSPKLKERWIQQKPSETKVVLVKPQMSKAAENPENLPQKSTDLTPPALLQQSRPAPQQMKPLTQAPVQRSSSVSRLQNMPVQMQRSIQIQNPQQLQNSHVAKPNINSQPRSQYVSAYQNKIPQQSQQYLSQQTKSNQGGQPTSQSHHAYSQQNIPTHSQGQQIAHSRPAPHIALTPLIKSNQPGMQSGAGDVRIEKAKQFESNIANQSRSKSTTKYS